MRTVNDNIHAILTICTVGKPQEETFEASVMTSDPKHGKGILTAEPSALNQSPIV